jgi:hypothetical protein
MRLFESTKELRRSTRVSLEVSIDVEEESSRQTVTGITQVVNLHGALIRTARPLKRHSKVTVSVFLTGKKSRAKVIHVTEDNPLKAGIELEAPQNIWGVSLIPDDWDDLDSGR